jgi:hypothetical protein
VGRAEFDRQPAAVAQAPRAIKILAYFTIVWGSLGSVLCFFLLLLLVIYPGALEGNGEPGTMALLFLILILFGIGEVALGIGILRLHRWAYWCTLFLAGITCLFGLLGFMFALIQPIAAEDALRALASLVIAVCVLVLLVRNRRVFRPHVSEAGG